MKKIIPLLVLAAAPFALNAEPVSYTVDPAHSSVGFSVRHIISKTKGVFGEFTGKITLDAENLDASSANAEIKIASISTSNEKRDAHLKGADFFKADKNPVMTFKSTKIKSAGADTYTLTGDLTFAGVTKPVTLKLVKTGETNGPKKIAAFEASGTLKRSDWGMTYGSAMVGDEVALSIEIEAAVGE